MSSLPWCFFKSHVGITTSKTPAHTVFLIKLSLTTSVWGKRLFPGVCDLDMSHFSDISLTSAHLFPAAVGPTGLSPPEALAEEDCCQTVPAKLKCQACVPGPDPYSASTNPDCSLSAPPAPRVHRYVTHTRLLFTFCPSELSSKWGLLIGSSSEQMISLRLFQKGNAISLKIVWKLNRGTDKNADICF